MSAGFARSVEHAMMGYAIAGHAVMGHAVAGR